MSVQESNLPKVEPSQPVVEVRVDPNFDDLFSDNRWLIDKLELLIGENTALRRMIGSKI